ncbi:MAG: UDP-N-acetylmuramoyl-L-alanyl-D-glutamate--2,6-diaminopimelate ligase [Thermodesulfobacteriota bacterium]
MKLSRIMDALRKDGRDNPVAVPGAPDREISGVSASSRKVEPGFVFVAIPGTAADGHDFIPDAVSRGASAVILERAVELPPGVVAIRVKSSRRALAAVSACWFGDPSRSLKVVGITGTNGKTTVSYFLEAVLAAAGFSTGVVGTVNCRYNGQVFETGVTTPDSWELQEILACMRDAGVTHVVMEVSSHALVQDRVRRVSFDCALFTNLTQDHLDFHKDMESYGAAKALFFTDYAADNGEKAMYAVINRDDAFGDSLCRLARCKVVTTGLAGGRDIFGSDVAISPEGLSGRVRSPLGEVFIHSDMAGLHNFRNILSVAGAAHCLGIPPALVKKGIEGLSRVPGRLDRVKNDLCRNVFVDYAHSPDALMNVLSALRACGAGRIITVMGCGGDRDRKKRPLMGEAAARLSDLLVVTSDNPRSEDPDAIIAEILPGVTPLLPALSAEDLRAAEPAAGFFVEPAREKAIEAAVLASRPGDTLLIAGKGHENYQIIGKAKRHFDDREQAAAALALIAARQDGQCSSRPGRRP